MTTTLDTTNMQIVELGNHGVMEIGDIEVTVVNIRADRVRLGIETPSVIPVHKGENYTLRSQASSYQGRTQE